MASSIFSFPEELLEDRTQDGSVENDHVAINDIVLRIPPEQITIYKSSLNHEFATLRSLYTQQIKSGYGDVNVAMTMVFTNNDDFNKKLKPLIAGLRATPFCVCYSLYLQQSLRGLEVLEYASDKDYFFYHPLALALKSLNVSTIPGQPGSLQVQLEFVWFNYLPYMKEWVYRIGDAPFGRGTVFHSDLWKAFYQPFLSSTDLDWPHDPDSDEPPAQIFFREYLTDPSYDAEANKAALDLARTLKRNPLKVQDLLVNFIQNEEVTWTDQNIWDVFWKKHGKEALAEGRDVNQSIHQAYDLSSIPDGAITASLDHAGLGANFTSLSARSAHANDWLPPAATNANAVDKAIKALTYRQAEIKAFDKHRPSTTVPATDTVSGYVPLPQLTVTHDYEKSGGIVQTAQVFGRKRRVALDQPNGIIIEGISVTISYNLAMIPMMAYRYPTIQYTGGVDIKATLMMSCTNKGAAKLNTAYDMVESMAHRYRMIPQAYQNLWIQNDLLNFLGLREFITQHIRTDTVKTQPGRSSVVLELSHAPVTTDTRIGSPEVLNQEALWTTEGIQLAIAHRLHEFTVAGNTAGKTDIREYLRRPKIDPNHPKKKAIGTLITRYCEAYNKALRATFKTLFQDTFQVNFLNSKLLAAQYKREKGHAPDQEEFKVYAEQANRQGVQDAQRREEEGVSKDFSIRSFEFLMSIREKDSIFGLVPNVGDMQKAVADMEKAKNGGGPDAILPGSQGTSSSPAAVARSLRHAKRLRRLGISDAEASQIAQSIANEIDRFERAFSFLYTYKAGLKELSDDIQLRYLDLPELKGIAEAIYASDVIQKSSSAYRDFQPQIESTISLLQTKYVSAEPNVTLYNPDLYLFNAATDGPNVSIDNFGMMSSKVLARAQELSVRSYRNAEKSVGNWFQDNYFSALGGGNNPLPAIQVLAHVSDEAKVRGTHIPKTYQHSIYSNQTFTNTLYGGTLDKAGNKIPLTKRIICDQGHRAHVNQMSQQQMGSANSIFTSNDFQSHWDGLETGQPGDRPASQNQQPSKDGDRIALPTPPPGSVMAKMVSFLKDFGIASGKVGLGSRWGGRFRNGPSGEKGTHEDWKALGIPGWDPMHVDNQYKVTDGDRDKQFPSSKSVSLDTLQPHFRRKAERILKMLISGKDEAGGQLGSGTKWEPWVLSTYDPRKGSKTAKDSKHKYGLAMDLGVKINGRNMHSTRVIKRYRAEIDRQIQRTLSKPRKPAAVRKDITSTVTSPMALSYNEFQQELYTGQALGLTRAYPSFKLFFIEDDQGEHRLGFDDFFNYSAVQSVRIVRDRHIAADMCELYVTNLSGVLSNRKFKQEPLPDAARDAQGKRVNENVKDRSTIGTDKENPIASMMLQEGVHFSLYLGYSNNQDNLELVFTGVITELEFMGSEEIIRVLGQSYAIELVQDIKGVSKPKTTDNMSIPGLDFWGLGGDAYTGDLLEEMITQPEVLHFGRWRPTRQYSTPERDLLTNKWHARPTPQDDNIFAPSPKANLREFADGILFQELRYTIYQTTIWDIFQEMTLRHPNYIAAAVPYREIGADRMTMFFGLPNQLYFARDPDLRESNATASMRRQQAELNQKLIGLQNEATKARNQATRSNQGTGSSYWGVSKDLDAIRQNPVDRAASATIQASMDSLRNDRLAYAKEAGYIKPFRKYHLLTSGHHIVSNNIQANARDVANSVTVRYNKDLPGQDDIIQGVSNADFAISNADEEMTVKLDAAMPDEEIRSLVASFLNVSNPNLARRYALGLLLRNTKNTYKGELVLLGNPSIKPHDVCYLYDEYNDMIGPIEVDRVTHVFTAQQGFLTEVKPAMLTQVGEWSLLHSCTAMGVVMEGAVKEIFGGGATSTVGQYAQAGLSLMAPVAGALVDYFGGFMSETILNYTQLGFPLTMSPLSHRGRVFAGGIPTHKLPKSMWKCIFGDWSPQAQEGFDLWLEDKIDDIMGTLKTATLHNSQGQFWNNSNTLDVE